MTPSPPKTALPFGEGQARGGRVLYEEADSSVKRRRRNARAAGVFISGPLLFGAGALFFGFSLAASLEFIASSEAGRLIRFVALAAMFAFGTAVLALAIWFLRASFRYAAQVTPKRVYEHGLSQGWGENPYFAREHLYCIEERQMRGGRGPYCVVTFVGGYNLSMAAIWAKNMRYETDYMPMLGAMRIMMGRFRPSPLWTSDAWARTANLRHSRGPARAIIEAIAAEEKAPTIDLGFLERNWKEVQEREAHGKHRLTDFAGILKLPEDKTPVLTASAVDGPAE